MSKEVNNEKNENEIFDFFLVLGEEGEIHRGEYNKEKSKFMEKIERKYVNGIKSFGERMFQTIDDQNIELDEINIEFRGNLDAKLNFGIIEIGGGTGVTISFKLKKNKS